MHADKISRQSDFMLSAQPRAAERLQKQDYPQTVGRLSPLMRKSFGQVSTAVLQVKQAQIQTKEQEQGNLSDALNSPGRPLPPQKRAHYENLLQTSLKHVTVHNMGSKESQILAKHNAIGLTDGQRVLANSEDTLRHELTHVKQHNEGHVPTDVSTRIALERDADRGAESLRNGQLVQSFSSGAQSATPTLQAKSAEMIQTKCRECEKKPKRQEQLKEDSKPDEAKERGSRRPPSTPQEMLETAKELARLMKDLLWIDEEVILYANVCFAERFAENLVETGVGAATAASICSVIPNPEGLDLVQSGFCASIVSLVASGVSALNIAECFEEYWRDRPLRIPYGSSHDNSIDA
ncbi:MAG: DUF4157 domain-containing protein [Cyanobacteria bacterium P01_G01_bin.54]